jgi:hypothetical protein
MGSLTGHASSRDLSSCIGQTARLWTALDCGSGGWWFGEVLGDKGEKGEMMQSF